MMNEQHTYIAYFLLNDNEKDIYSDRFTGKNHAEARRKLFQEYRGYKIYVLAVCRLY